MSGTFSCSFDDDLVLRSQGMLVEALFHDMSEYVSLLLVEESLSDEETS